jgi:hypothetical protein
MSRARVAQALVLLSLDLATSAWRQGDVSLFSIAARAAPRSGNATQARLPSPPTCCPGGGDGSLTAVGWPAFVPLGKKVRHVPYNVAVDVSEQRFMQWANTTSPQESLWGACFYRANASNPNVTIVLWTPEDGCVTFPTPDPFMPYCWPNALWPRFVGNFSSGAGELNMYRDDFGDHGTYYIDPTSCLPAFVDGSMEGAGLVGNVTLGTPPAEYFQLPEGCPVSVCPAIMM